eukprot:5786854-Amphidinium_carterae.1
MSTYRQFMLHFRFLLGIGAGADLNLGLYLATIHSTDLLTCVLLSKQGGNSVTKRVSQTNKTVNKLFARYKYMPYYMVQ